MLGEHTLFSGGQDEGISAAAGPSTHISLAPEVARHAQDWERWRERAESEWRRALGEKEAQLRQEVRREGEREVRGLVEDLTRAQQEVSRLEVKLRGALLEVERQ